MFCESDRSHVSTKYNLPYGKKDFPMEDLFVNVEYIINHRGNEKDKQKTINIMNNIITNKFLHFKITAILLLLYYH